MEILFCIGLALIIIGIDLFIEYQEDIKKEKIEKEQLMVDYLKFLESIDMYIETQNKKKKTTKRRNK